MSPGTTAAAADELAGLPPSPAVWCSGLRKRYGRQTAVDDVSFTVARAVGQADHGQALPTLGDGDVDAGEPDVQVQHLGCGEPRLVAEQLGQVPDRLA